MKTVYLDHNATTRVRPEVREEIAAVLAEPGNPSSAHQFGRVAREVREAARERVAAAAGCAPREVVFTSGGTEADHLALRGLTGGERGNHLIVGATEHEAVLTTASALRSTDTRVSILPVDGSGRIDPASLRDALRPDTALVSIMAANNETGVLAPLKELGEICREHGVLFHTDAVQCFGKVPFRFSDLPVDAASLSSHKIGGSAGSGALLLRKGIVPSGLVTGGGQERGIRPGTENLSGIAGFGRAAELAAREVNEFGSRTGPLRDRLEREIRAVFPESLVNGAEAPRLPNTSNIAFPGLNGETLMIGLDLAGIAVSTGAACAAGAAAPSGVLTAMGLDRSIASGTLRFSLGRETNANEIDRVLKILPGVVKTADGTGHSS
ncbi:MAG: cysteine desulfurase family protein [Gemmatimonadota bacterium]|nr:cysteine desulfurase family protein [Gemmatimonadota bacterium]MDP6801966.1 cysteine desulfurase family protein [Gemmatimonadota bacterium]MDP7031314.1 cysteine desulfurase family protein [Gemmatimonadota bacterium]